MLAPQVGLEPTTLRLTAEAKRFSAHFSDTPAISLFADFPSKYGQFCYHALSLDFPDFILLEGKLEGIRGKQADTIFR
jgi:hypothetical protein